MDHTQTCNLFYYQSCGRVTLPERGQVCGAWDGFFYIITISGSLQEFSSFLKVLLLFILDAKQNLIAILINVRS
jgi:hypothetical protein